MCIESCRLGNQLHALLRSIGKFEDVNGSWPICKSMPNWSCIVVSLIKLAWKGIELVDCSHTFASVVQVAGPFLPQAAHVYRNGLQSMMIEELLPFQLREDCRLLCPESSSFCKGPETAWRTSLPGCKRLRRPSAMPDKVLLWQTYCTNASQAKVLARAFRRSRNASRDSSSVACAPTRLCSYCWTASCSSESASLIKRGVNLLML